MVIKDTKYQVVHIHRFDRLESVAYRRQNTAPLGKFRVISRRLYRTGNGVFYGHPDMSAISWIFDFLNNIFDNKLIVSVKF